MRKSRTPGSVRGVSGNGYPYRDNSICSFIFRGGKADAVKLYTKLSTSKVLMRSRRSLNLFREMREKFRISCPSVASFTHNLINRHGNYGSDPRKPSHPR